MSDFADRLHAGEDVVNRWDIADGFVAEVQRSVALRVEVDQQNSLTLPSQSGGKIHAAGGFSDSTLLVHNRDSTHRNPFLTSLVPFHFETESDRWGPAAGV